MDNLKRSKFAKLAESDLENIQGGLCITTHHSFLGRTWTKEVCISDVTGQKTVCKTKDQ